MNKKGSLGIIKWILIFGTFLTLLSPFLFTRNVLSNALDFTETGQIGDTIGGITAPIVNLIGAILVFYALKAQIEANNLIQQQFEEQKQKENENKVLANISEYYKYFLKSIDDFRHESEKTIGNFDSRRKEIVIYNGTIAVKLYLNDLIKYGPKDVHDSKILLKGPKNNQYFSILKSLQTFIEILEQAKISDEDKLFYKNIIKPLFENTLKPNKDDLEKVNQFCDKCSEIHSRFPTLFLETYNELEEKIQKI